MTATARKARAPLTARRWTVLARSVGLVRGQQLSPADAARPFWFWCSSSALLSRCLLAPGQRSEIRGLPCSRTSGPPKEQFGAATAIYGTLVTSVIAMLIAVPVGLGIAVFLTELCWLPPRRPIGIAIELLAGFPPSSTASGRLVISGR